MSTVRNDLQCYWEKDASALVGNEVRRSRDWLQHHRFDTEVLKPYAPNENFRSFARPICWVFSNFEFSLEFRFHPKASRGRNKTGTVYNLSNGFKNANWKDC